MELGIEGRTALVAASSRGLGRAVAGTLAAEGADLVLCARGEEDLEAAVAEIRSEHDVRAIGVPADLDRREEAEVVVEAARDAFGGVDILVTNSGGPPPGPFEEHEPEAWRGAYHGLLESAVVLIRGVLPGMRERGWGRIVLITSIAVKQPVDGLVLSNSLRAAVTGMAKTLSNEVAADGVTVNTALPGYTSTERLDALAERIARDEGIEPEEAADRWRRQIPAGRLADPSEFADAVAFLCSERAAYVTGAALPVDGGWIRSLV